MSDFSALWLWIGWEMRGESIIGDVERAVDATDAADAEHQRAFEAFEKWEAERWGATWPEPWPPEPGPTEGRLPNARLGGHVFENRYRCEHVCLRCNQFIHVERPADPPLLPCEPKERR